MGFDILRSKHELKKLQVFMRKHLFSCGVSANFPSPADDYIDRKLDLNELLIHNPPATFFVRVAGDSMTEAGINHNDILFGWEMRKEGACLTNP